MDICLLGNTDSIITRRWIESFKDDFEISVITLGKRTVKGVLNYNIGINERTPAIFPRSIKTVKTDEKGKKTVSRTTHFTRLTTDLFGVVSGVIERIKPKVLHAHYITDYGFMGFKSGKHPFLCHAYGSDVYITPWKNHENEKRAGLVVNGADLMLIVAKTMKEHLEKLGCDRHKMKYVPICTDVDFFDPRRKRREQSHGRNVLSIRKLNPVYDVETLVRAIPIVLNRFPDVKFTIAGRGTEEEKLKQLSKSLGVSQNVGFVGEVDYAEMPGLIGGSDICVSTALSDGTPNSVCEAMAMEKAVIATEVGDVPHMINDGETGILIPKKSPEVLANKIIYLLENESVMRNMGKKARKSISKNYNWGKWKPIMKKIYSDFI